MYGEVQYIESLYTVRSHALLGDHTLDLLIARSTSTILSSVSSTDPTLSEHLAILFSITVPPHFKSQAKLVAHLISSSKRTYYKDLILQTSKQPKKLWSTLQSLLSLKTPTILPTSISTSCLAKSFLDFFKDKIEDCLVLMILIP